MTTKSENISGDQGSPPPAPDADDEFDAAMAEAASAKEAPAGLAAATKAQDEPGDDTGEPPAPADKAAATDAPPAAQTPSGPSQDDIWHNAPAELRTAYETALRDAELRLKSVQGRQSASDREVARLRDELAKLTAGKQEPSKGEAKDEQKGDEPDETFKQLLDDYPEIAGPLVSKIKALEAKLSPIEEGVSKAERARTDAYLAEQENILTEQQPDWLEALQDERFVGWLDEQPRPVREAFERNRQAIVDGKEAAWLVGTFKTALGIGSKTADPQPDTAADERRKRQLANGRDFGRGSGPPATDGIPDDFDAAFDVASRKKDAQLAAR